MYGKQARVRFAEEVVDKKMQSDYTNKVEGAVGFLPCLCPENGVRAESVL